MRKYRAKKALRRALERADRLGVDLVDVFAAHLGLDGTDRLIITRQDVTPIGVTSPPRKKEKQQHRAGVGVASET